MEMVGSDFRSTWYARRLCAALFYAAIVVLHAGCTRQPVTDPTRASVAGTVLFDDKPLGGGSITFLSKKDANYRITGMIKNDGSFAFDGAPVGEAQLAVETDSLRYADPAHFVPIPAKYRAIETSGLSFEVQPGDNTNVKVELKSR